MKDESHLYILVLNEYEWFELVKYGVFLPFIVFMDRDSYSLTDQNEKRDSYPWTE